MLQARWAIMHGGWACRQGWSVIEVTDAVPARTAMKTALAGRPLGYPPDAAAKRRDGPELAGRCHCSPRPPSTTRTRCPMCR